MCWEFVRDISRGLLFEELLTYMLELQPGVRGGGVAVAVAVVVDRG